jgi:hypothetical protein
MARIGVPEFFRLVDYQLGIVHSGSQRRRYFLLTPDKANVGGVVLRMIPEGKPPALLNQTRGGCRKA